MAPMSSLDAAAHSQRSILTLDKSEEPFSTQINAAGSILGICLDVQWKEVIESEGGQSQRRNIISDPRHGHALRWLLRKLQSAEAGPCSPRLHFKAWILLRELLIRTPLTHAARLVKEHKFINSLKETFHWLHENFDQEQLPSYSQNGIRSDSSESGYESGGGSSDEKTTARKRKRDGTEVVPQRESDRPAVVLDTLYVAICGVVKQLEAFAIHEAHVSNYAAEHMRAALKSSPEEAAIILGSSMYLVNHILQLPNRRRRRNRRASTWASLKRLEDTAYKSCISSMIEFWNLLSPAVQGQLGELSNHAFMAHCILPNLHLLNTYQEWAEPNADVDPLQDSLKALLVQHVILPFRASLDPRSSKTQDTSDNTTAFAGLLTTAIRNFRFHHAHINGGADRRRGEATTKTYLAITCLSLLFNIAIGCRRRNAPELRRIEDSWLEAFFSRILDCASVVLETSSSGRGQKDLVRLTKWILRGVLDYKITLSTTKLESILDQTSGLFDTEWAKGRVEWSLVSLCLLSDPNVFVIPSITPKDKQDCSYRTPNRYLAALFSHMTQESCDKPSYEDASYAFKLEMVLLPLLRAFADARNLTGFMGHWREQLTAASYTKLQPLEEPGSELQNHPTIWEDDTLLRSVADLCESNLTIGQMQSLVEDARQNLESAKIANGGLYATIIILDCVYFGCSREDTLSTLARSAQLAFHTVASFITAKSDLIQGYQWRLWRILTVINDRWDMANEARDVETAYYVAIKARDLLSLGDSGNASEVGPDYSDRLHSFNFLLSFAASERSDLPDVSLRDIMVQGIEKVLDLKEFFCRQLREDHFGVLKPLDTDPEWTGQSYGIKTLDSLYISCIARLLLSAKVLSCLDPKQIERLFEQLYRLAIHRRTSSQPLSKQRVDYDWLWQALCRSDTLIENAIIAHSLRDFRATQFLNLLGSKDSRYWNINTVQYSLAFETIQGTPSSALSKRHRTEIANQIFRIMLYKKVLSLANMTEYIDLLTKLIEHPNGKMAILSNASGLSQNDSVEAEIRHDESNFEPALIALADKINEEPWSTDNGDCFIALRRLTQVVIRHLLSTMTSGTSLQYLKDFYGWLSGALNDGVDSSDVTPSRSIVIGVFLTSYSRHRAGVPDSMKRELETLDVLRQRHLEILIEKSNVAGRNLSEPKPRHCCGIMLESMVPYSDLLCIHPDLRNIHTRLAGLVDQVRDVNYMGEEASQNVRRSYMATDYLQSRFTRLEYALGIFDCSLHPSFLGTAQILRTMQSSEKADLLRHFQERMDVVGWQQKEDLLNALIHKPQNECQDEASLEVLQRTLISIKDQEVDDLRTVLSQVFMTLCTNMLEPNDAHISITSMQCMSIVLQKNHRVISQWHIDSLLANVTIEASQLHELTNSHKAALRYLGLCRLLTTVLTRHRSKIGGRYHLVLPALQSLLRCLFTPYNLASDNGDPPSAFAPAHASSYVRLLTTLADPTVSSVTSSKKRSRLDLNDETKKGRSIAGQHLPYLIMEYCMCQLKGRLTPEMKAALERGLHAVLKVMTRERMRTMNAALDESGRAVWKVLYEDWRRFDR